MKRSLIALILCNLILILTIIFVRAPIALPFYLAEHQKEFFHGSSYGILQRGIFRLITTKYLYDWAWQEVQIIEKKSSNDAEKIALAIESVKSLVYTQRQIRHQPLNQVPYARLINGLTWCDGINYFLALLLKQMGFKAELWAIRDHTTVRIFDYKEDVFADAWSDVPLFALNASDDLPVNIPIYDDVAKSLNHEKYEFREGRTFVKVYSSIVPVGIWYLPMLDVRKFGNTARDGKYFDNSFKWYSFARILETYRNYEDARDFYQLALQADCDGNHCKIAKDRFEFISSRLNINM